MNTCATCKFFGSPAPLTWFIYDGDEEGESDHRLCARIEHGNGGSGQQTKKLASDLAVVTDGSGYAARLRVLPTFGCVLHEPAQEPSDGRQAGTNAPASVSRRSTSARNDDDG